MNCEQLLAYLSDYIDHNLNEELTTEAQYHLATCHNCQVVLDTTQKTIFLYREQEKRMIPAMRKQQLFAKLQEAFMQNSNK